MVKRLVAPLSYNMLVDLQRMLFIGTGGYLLELGAISGMTGAKVAPPSALWAGARKT